MDSPPPAAAGFLRLMADYGNLMARVDSEENPHESKYAARKLLEEYMHSLPTGSTAVDSATGFTVGDQLAVADGKLGVNFLQSEETSAAEKPLIHCVEHVVARVGVPPLPQSASDSSSASTAAAPAAAPSPTPLSGPMLLRLLLAGIEACNYLALLYSGWDNHAGALRFLTHAKALFARARACASGADGRPRRAGAAGASDGPADAADGGDSTSAATGDATAVGGATAAGGASAAGGAVGVAGGGGGDVRVLLVSLDALYTHTLFYLAQVHGHLGQQALAHRYIEATLARQLREQAYRATPALPLQQQQQQPADAAVASIETGVGDGGAADADAAAATSAIATPVAAAAGGLSAVFAVDRNEWVRNALRLSELYSGRAQWAAAAHCLAAADVVLHQAVQAVRRDASTAPGADGAAASGGGGGSATSGAAAGAGRSRDPCAQGNLADLPDAMQRLYAELALHWARLYLECMRLGREREAAAAEAGSAAAGAGGGSAAASATGGKLSPEAEKEFERGWDRQWGSGAAALPADAAPAAEEETEDPFTTTPAPKWPSAPKAGGAEASAGAAADVEDDTELLAQLAPSSGAASRAASGTPGGTAAGAVHGGPFAEFLMSQASSVSPSRYSSYGPLHIASPPPPAGQAARAAAAVQPPCPGLCLSGLRLVPVPRTLTSFEAARDVFKAVNVACQRSLAYFPLDGFVSDHVGVQQMLSKAYKYVSRGAGTTAGGVGVSRGGGSVSGGARDDECTLWPGLQSYAASLPRWRLGSAIRIG